MPRVVKEINVGSCSFSFINEPTAFLPLGIILLLERDREGKEVRPLMAFLFRGISLRSHRPFPSPSLSLLEASLIMIQSVALSFALFLFGATDIMIPETLHKERDESIRRLFSIKMKFY